jgi:hypothetical protein
VSGDLKVVHMENVKPFFSDSYEDAFKSALVDYSQHVIDRVVTWAGDPETRSKLFWFVSWMGKSFGCRLGRTYVSLNLFGDSVRGVLHCCLF